MGYWMGSPSSTDPPGLVQQGHPDQTFWIKWLLMIHKTNLSRHRLRLVLFGREWVHDCTQIQNSILLPFRLPRVHTRQHSSLVNPRSHPRLHLRRSLVPPRRPPPHPLGRRTLTLIQNVLRGAVESSPTLAVVFTIGPINACMCSSAERNLKKSVPHTLNKAKLVPKKVDKISDFPPCLRYVFSTSSNSNDVSAQ